RRGACSSRTRVGLGWATALPACLMAHRQPETTMPKPADCVTLCSATLGEDGIREPPLGPLYIASALEATGVQVEFRDFQVEEGANGFSGEPLARFLSGHREIVAISCFVDMLPAVVDATRRLYEARPETL